MSKGFARIVGVRSALPEKMLTNEDLAAAFPEWNVPKIYQKTGIRTRHLAGKEECASDLGVQAAQKLFETGLARPTDIDYLLFCTQSPDYFLPTTACLVQQRLGLPTSCGALDFNLGCSGFVYGLSLAKGLIETGQASSVLLITAETYSKFLHPRDKSVRTLFGDGAAATLIRAEAGEKPWLGPFLFGTDGSGAENLIVKAGAKRACRPTANDKPSLAGIGMAPAVVPGPDHLYMNGGEIFTFTLRAVPDLVHALLRQTNLTMDQVDLFLLHQANHFILDALRRHLNIPPNKLAFHLEDAGNTVSATIPMALELLLEQGQLRHDHKVMMIGFGVGYSWAGCMVQL